MPNVRKIFNRAVGVSPAARLAFLVSSVNRNVRTVPDAGGRATSIAVGNGADTITIADNNASEIHAGTANGTVVVRVGTTSSMPVPVMTRSPAPWRLRDRQRRRGDTPLPASKALLCLLALSGTQFAFRSLRGAGLESMPVTLSTTQSNH